MHLVDNTCRTSDLWSLVMLFKIHSFSPISLNTFIYPTAPVSLRTTISGFFSLFIVDILAIELSGLIIVVVFWRWWLLFSACVALSPVVCHPPTPFLHPLPSRTVWWYLRLVSVCWLLLLLCYFVFFFFFLSPCLPYISSFPPVLYFGVHQAITQYDYYFIAFGVWKWEWL